MKPSHEPMTEVLTDLLNSLNNVGIELPTHNTRSHTGAISALSLKLKTKLTKLFIERLLAEHMSA